MSHPPLPMEGLSRKEMHGQRLARILNSSHFNQIGHLKVATF
jgi:hypothetical protein